jgi:hypothetical protein
MTRGELIAGLVIDIAGSKTKDSVIDNLYYWLNRWIECGEMGKL